MRGLGLGLRLGLRGGYSGEPSIVAPTYIGFEMDPGNAQPGTLTNNGDGSYTATRNSGADVFGAFLVRSAVPIVGDYVFELETIVMPTVTPGFLGVDDAVPALATFQNGAGTVMGSVPATDGYLYTKKPGNTDLLAVLGGWGASVGAKIFMVRIGTTVTFRSGTGTYTAASIKATTTDTTDGRYAGWDQLAAVGSFKFRFYAI